VLMRDNLKSVDASLNLAQHIAQLGSWEYNYETQKTFWSDELYHIFGKGYSSLVPDYNAFIDCIHPDDKGKVSGLIYQCLNERKPFSCECRLYREEGFEKIVFLQADVSLNDQGEPAKLFGIVQDITKRKKAEAAVEAKNHELERKNRELEQFAYITSHDLQEPLRTITSFTDHFHKLYHNKLDVTGQKFLHYIAQGAERMRVLIKDLLDYSRIGRNAEVAAIDCNTLVFTVLADLNTAIQESGAKIKTDRLPVIHGNTTEIKQLFQNLIANAIKFRNKEASPQIRISSSTVAGGHEFIVRDNGIGIPEEHGERIFVIFQRLHTRTQYEGSGIGLSHCKKIVELHGGRIWVKSTPGQGSAFHFTILEDHN
jgi:PAS domain S-box-containing protein